MPFTPEDFLEASVPEQRRLLSRGIARVEVTKGTRHDLEKRVRIVFVEDVSQGGNGSQ